MEPAQGTFDPASEPLKMTDRQQLEEQIQYELSQIKKNKGEMKVAVATIKQRLLANTNYSKANEAVKEATKVRTQAKKQAITDDPEIAALESKIRAVRVDNKMRQLSLSDYLLEFEGMTGANTVADQEGELFSFEKYAKLV